MLNGKFPTKIPTRSSPPTASRGGISVPAGSNSGMSSYTSSWVQYPLCVAWGPPARDRGGISISAGLGLRGDILAGLFLWLWYACGGLTTWLALFSGLKLVLIVNCSKCFGNSASTFTLLFMDSVASLNCISLVGATCAVGAGLIKGLGWDTPALLVFWATIFPVLPHLSVDGLSSVSGSSSQSAPPPSFWLDVWFVLWLVVWLLHEILPAGVSFEVDGAEKTKWSAYFNNSKENINYHASNTKRW